MISISGQTEKYVLDLNTSTDSHIELTIDSSINGSRITWVISYISDPILDVHSFSSNKLSIDTNLKELKKEEFIILKNIKKEEIIIIVKPNIEMSRERNYTFKLGKSTISSKTITINIVSKENGTTEPWEIVRHGEPISYEISSTKTKLVITLTAILASEVTTNFELQQINSGKIINFKLNHKDNNSVELIKEAD